MDDIANSQVDLLSFFDVSEIFSDFNNEINDIQKFLLKFFIAKDVKGVNSLVSEMPKELKFNFFYECYEEFYNIDNRPFWFSKIIFCLQDQEIIKFVWETIDNITDEEILFMIKELYENKKDIILHTLISNERIMNIIIQNVNAPFFYEMIEDLKLPNILLNKRQKELQTILTNYQDYDTSDVKEAFCDLYLRDTLKNVCLDIKTIIDFAKNDAVLREEYLGETYTYLCKLFNFLSNDDSDFQIINSNIPINYELLSKCYLMCQKRFKNLVLESISQNVTENIEPRILISSSGQEVKFYNIEHQTEKQKNITMLVSTIPCADTALEFKQIYYSNQNGEIKNNRRSCSLINETKLLSLFGGKNRITFGYEDLTGRSITSATLCDGRTDGNEVRFRRKRKVVKSNYNSIDKFISGTQGHNEVTINMNKMNKVMIPSYILITREKPTQFEIDVAAEFQIPIRYINIKKYKQEPDQDYAPEDYDYYQFQKKELVSKKNELKL